MKSAALMICAALIIMLMPACLISINSFRLADQEDPFNSTTAAGVTSENVTLSQDLYSDDTSYVTVTSNLTADAPIASSYASGTNVLTITGLVESESRRLDVSYKIDGLSDYWGAGTAAKVWPIMLALGVIGVVVGAVIYATHRGGD